LSRGQDILEHLIDLESADFIKRAPNLPIMDIEPNDDQIVLGNQGHGKFAAIPHGKTRFRCRRLEQAGAVGGDGVLPPEIPQTAQMIFRVFPAPQGLHIGDFFSVHAPGAGQIHRQACAEHIPKKVSVHNLSHVPAAVPEVQQAEAGQIPGGDPQPSPGGVAVERGEGVFKSEPFSENHAVEDVVVLWRVKTVDPIK
jgi:hypothetical protein